MSASRINATVRTTQFSWRLDDDGSVSLGGEKIPAEVSKISPNGISILFKGRSYFVMPTRNNFGYSVIINGKYIEVGTEDSTKHLAAKILGESKRTSSRTEVRSPMPGIVVRCEVQETSHVKAGDGLLILEAMKMENEIKASTDGVVTKMFVKDRQVVEKGELLLIIS